MRYKCKILKIMFILSRVEFDMKFWIIEILDKKVIEEKMVLEGFSGFLLFWSLESVHSFSMRDHEG